MSANGFLGRLLGRDGARDDSGTYYSGEEIGTREAGRGAPEVGHQPRSSTIEHLAGVIADLPSGVPWQSAVLVVRKTLDAAGVKLSEVDASARTLESKLSTEIELTQDRQKEFREIDPGGRALPGGGDKEGPRGLRGRGRLRGTEDLSRSGPLGKGAARARFLRASRHRRGGHRPGRARYTAAPRALGCGEETDLWYTLASRGQWSGAVRRPLRNTTSGRTRRITALDKRLAMSIPIWLTL